MDFGLFCFTVTGTIYTFSPIYATFCVYENNFSTYMFYIQTYILTIFENKGDGNFCGIIKGIRIGR
jgi:hypothetical protein